MDSITAQIHASFSGGTLVHTENGLVPIQEIQRGDMLLSRDENIGENIYQPVLNIIRTNNEEITFIRVEEYLDSAMLKERRRQRRAGIPQEDIRSMDVLLTSNHPLWIENKGWIPVFDLKSGDLLLNKDSKKYEFLHPGYDGDVRAKVYKTAHSNIGFRPNYGLEYSQDGVYIDLTTGKEIQDDALQRNAENDPTLAKLYQNNPEWEQDLRDELGVPAGEPTEFFGFKTGEWVDPSSIDKNTLATTTVYNLEVANTHTYFVGEEGIWVHDGMVNQSR